MEEVVVNGKREGNRLKPKGVEHLIEGLVRPNARGNTGRYNNPGRWTDKYYSDWFLKKYYGVDDENND